MKIEILQISIEEKSVLQNLLELYNYDCSQYEESDVNNYGLYGYKYLDHYWTEKNRFPFLIKVDNKIAGFIMIDDYKYYENSDTKYSISEFFIMYKYRNKGIGKYAVKEITNKYKGKWQLGYNPKNIIGKKFWNKTINEITKGKYEYIKNDQTLRYEDGTYSEVLIFETE